MARPIERTHPAGSFKNFSVECLQEILDAGRDCTTSVIKDKISTPHSDCWSWESDMFFRPLHDHIAVRPIDISARTAGGIFIPDAAKTKPDQGEVIAIGPGRRDKRGRREPPALKPGQRVLFDVTSGTEIKINGDKLFIMKEDDVLAVVKHSNFANPGTALLATSALLAVVIGILAARAIGIV